MLQAQSCPDTPLATSQGGQEQRDPDQSHFLEELEQAAAAVRNRMWAITKLKSQARKWLAEERGLN